jgi:hypothetical protein
MRPPTRSSRPGVPATAHEEERRRLRRHLLDGLGPALAGIALTLQAAENAGGPAAVPGLYIRGGRGHGQNGGHHFILIRRS